MVRSVQGSGPKAACAVSLSGARATCQSRVHLLVPKLRLPRTSRHTPEGYDRQSGRANRGGGMIARPTSRSAPDQRTGWRKMTQTSVLSRTPNSRKPQGFNSI